MFQAEVKSIIKKRTDFEYTLKRRQLETADFSAYLQYEINLDKLHISRTKRLESSNTKEKIGALRSIKAAFIRHISYIFERAVRRFSDELSLWEDYIAFLKAKQSNNILNTVFGRALALHPKAENFWLQAAMHELEVNGNSHAARVLLQRAIRANKSSKIIWLKYFELELWNAVRVVERQKGLDLEVTQEVVDEGAPLIVFRHAMDALVGAEGTTSSSSKSQTAINDILAMHLSCEGVVSSLSDILEDELKGRFSTNWRLWEHLVALRVNRVLNHGHVNSNNAKSNRKRKHLMQRASVETAVASVTGAISVCIELLTEGGVSHSEFTDDNDEALPLSGEFLSMAVSAISETLLKSGQIVVYAARNAANQSSTSVPAKRAKKAKEEEAVVVESEAGDEIIVDQTDEEGSGDEDNNDEVSVDAALHQILSLDVASKKQLAGLLTPLLAVLKQLEEYSVAIPTVQDAVARNVLQAQFNSASHQVWLFARLLQLPTATVADTVAVNDSVLQTWIEGSVSDVLTLVSRSPGVCKFDLSHLMDVWAGVATELLHSLTGDVTHRLQLCQTLVIAAPMLASSSSPIGNKLLMLAIQTAAADSWSIAEQLFRAVLSSAVVNSDQNHKGMWGSKYLQFVVETKDDSMLSLREAFAWLMQTSQARPQIFVGANLEALFALMLDKELAAVNIKIGQFGADEAEGVVQSREQLQVALSLSKAVAEKAVVKCPTVGPFWEALADIERRVGNHKAANHLLWKKSRDC